MKVAAADNKVFTAGTGKKTKFRINANRQAFKILSDGLYANKILAIVRELSTNGRDSHIDAGKPDLPILIHLPNSLEPWFAVRDYGVGLSPESIMTIYNSYFESTKTTSNDVTGCLGLGSKSPFSYTEQFTVTSWFNGTKTLYSAYVDEDGAPAISVTASSKTDEGNGLEVQMAVESSDFYRFVEAARQALIRFDPLPEVVGVADFEFKPIDYSIDAGKWALRKNENGRYNQEQAVAVQGSVAYPISVNAIKALTGKQRSILAAPIDIHFDIGELMVTASRESLSYGDKEPTSESIKKACDKIISELPAAYQKEFVNCKSLWDAKIRYAELIDNAPYGIQLLMSNNDFSIKWKGHDINSKRIRVPSDKYIRKTGSKDYPNIEFELDFRLFERRSKRRGWGSLGPPRAHKVDLFSNEWTFNPSHNIKFMYNDVGRGAHSRVTHYMMEHDFEAEAKKTGIKVDRSKLKVYLIESKKEALVKKLSKELGNPGIINVSDLPKPPKKQRQSTPGVKVHKYNPNGYDDRNKWEPTSLDFKNTSGIYVAINRYKPFHDDEDMSSDFSIIVKNAIDLGILDDKTPIYGVYPRYAKKLVDNPNWTNLFDMITNKVKIIVKKEKLAKVFINRSSVNNLRVMDIVSTEKSSWDNVVDADSAFKLFIDHYRSMSNNYCGYVKTDSIAFRAEAANVLLRKVAHTTIDTSNVKPDYDLKAEWETVLKTYPMLQATTDDSYYYHRRNIKTDTLVKMITDYVNLVDAS